MTVFIKSKTFRCRDKLLFYFTVDERTRLIATDKPIHPLHSKAIDRMSWRQTVEKTGDAPSFTKPLLPLKAKGLIFSLRFFINTNPNYSFI